MSSIIAIRTELEARAYDFGCELAAALVLAGERAGRDRQMMRDITPAAAREIRSAVEWLREGELPEQLVKDYESPAGWVSKLSFML